MKQHAIDLSLCVLAAYVGMAFVTAEVNPFNWTEFGRMTMAIGSLPLFLLTRIARDEIEGKNKEEPKA